MSTPKPPTRAHRIASAAMKDRVLHRWATLGIGVCLAVGAVACGNGPPHGSQKPGGSPIGTVVRDMPADATVKATDSLLFSPTSITVKVGGVLEFDNSGSVFHNVTFTDHSDLDDSNFPGGAKWQIKFTKAGSYPFVCTIHATTMKGTVSVS